MGLGTERIMTFENYRLIRIRIQEGSLQWRWGGHLRGERGWDLVSSGGKKEK